MNENNQPNQQGGQEGQQTPPTPQPPYQPPYGSQPPYDGQTPPPYQSPYEKPGQQPYQPPYGGYPPPEPPKTRAPLNPETIKLFNILSYFSFLWLVGLIADGHNPKVRYHVNQGSSSPSLRWYWGWWSACSAACLRPYFLWRWAGLWSLRSWEAPLLGWSNWRSLERLPL